jgi:hypothetical protein
MDNTIIDQISKDLYDYHDVLQNINYFENKNYKQVARQMVVCEIGLRQSMVDSNYFKNVLSSISMKELFKNYHALLDRVNYIYELYVIRYGKNLVNYVMNQAHNIKMQENFGKLYKIYKTESAKISSYFSIVVLQEHIDKFITSYKQWFNSFPSNSLTHRKILA